MPTTKAAGAGRRATNTNSKGTNGAAKAHGRIAALSSFQRGARRTKSPTISNTLAPSTSHKLGMAQARQSPMRGLAHAKPASTTAAPPTTNSVEREARRISRARASSTTMNSRAATKVSAKAVKANCSTVSRGTLSTVSCTTQLPGFSKPPKLMPKSRMPPATAPSMPKVASNGNTIIATNTMAPKPPMVVNKSAINAIASTDTTNGSSPKSSAPDLTMRSATPLLCNRKLKLPPSSETIIASANRVEPCCITTPSACAAPRSVSKAAAVTAMAAASTGRASNAGTTRVTIAAAAMTNSNNTTKASQVPASISSSVLQGGGQQDSLRAAGL